MKKIIDGLNEFGVTFDEGPINETEGLDFDPSWFTEARDNKVRTGHYTSYRSGTKQHRDFWKEEFRRCIDGYESHRYRITGDNYFFLNYYRLKNVTDVTVTGKGRQTGFPQFFSKQYEYFHRFRSDPHR